MQSDNDDIAASLGRWIRDHRDVARLTQDQLAQRAGLSKSYVSTLERAGDHPLTGKPVLPKREAILALSRALGADPDEALLAAGYAPSSPWPDREAEDRDFDLSTDPVIQALATGMDADAIEAAKKAVIDGARVTLAEFVRARQAGKKAE